MKPSTRKVHQLLAVAGATGVTTGQFAEARCPRASARILELRRDGYDVETIRIGSNSFRYVLHPRDVEAGAVAGETPLAAPVPTPSGPLPSTGVEVEQRMAGSPDLPGSGTQPARLFDLEDVAA